MPHQTRETDSEKDPEPPEPIKGGYDRLARLMGDVPDHAIFRRFAHLSAESILHYQAELYELELELKRVQKEDREAGEHTDRRTYAFNSRNLRQSVDRDDDSDNEDDGRDSRQWKIMGRIRDLLKEYYSALTLHQQIVNLNKPHRGHLDALKEYMNRISMGNIYLTGEDDEIWNVSSLDELVTMEPTTQDGTTSSRSTVSLVKLYHNVIGRHFHKKEASDHLQNSVLYHDAGVFKVIRVSKALTASMLPIVSIVVLHVVKDTEARLGVIAAFTAAFSLTLCYFTSASIKDVFSATAAFSAVLVVFIGTTDQSL